MAKQTRATLAEAVAMRLPEYGRSVAHAGVDCLFYTMIEHLAQGGKLKLHRFGNFDVRSKGSRVGTDIRTGERMELAPRKVVRFVPSRLLRDAMRGQHGRGRKD